MARTSAGHAQLVYFRVAFPRVASTARAAAVEPGLLGSDDPEAPLRLPGVLEAASAASAIFEPGREWRVPTGSRSASMGGFFFITSPVRLRIVVMRVRYRANKHTATTDGMISRNG